MLVQCKVKKKNIYNLKQLVWLEMFTFVNNFKCMNYGPLPEVWKNQQLQRLFIKAVLSAFIHFSCNLLHLVLYDHS